MITWKIKMKGVDAVIKYHDFVLTDAAHWWLIVTFTRPYTKHNNFHIAKLI